MKRNWDLVRDPSDDPSTALAAVVRGTATRMLFWGILLGVGLTVGFWPRITDGKIHLRDLAPVAVLLLITAAEFTYRRRAGIEAARRLNALPEGKAESSQPTAGRDG